MTTRAPSWRQRLQAAGIAVKGSPPIQLARAVPEYLAWKHEKPCPGDTVLADLAVATGMGALMAYVMRAALWAEQNDVGLTITARSPLYGSGEDVLGKYFERPETPETLRPLSKAAREWLLKREIPIAVPRDNATILFERHFTPSTVLQSLIDEVCGDVSFDLSIHFRGTDKFMETGFVSHEAMLEAAEPYLAKAARVFLATDDASFAKVIRTNWPDTDFVSYDLGEVAPGKARHFSDLSQQDKAKEALVNMFALARAPLCMRTMSYLSAFTPLINPDIRTLTVNGDLADTTPFPESWLLEREAQAS